MKTVNFKSISSDEILTRDELKKIVGGNGSTNVYAQACEGRADGSSCVVSIGGVRKSGYCKYGLTGPLVCFV